MYNSQDTIGLKDAASILGVSSATVRNWIKYGYVQPVKSSEGLLFKADEVQSLRTNILNGSVDRLTKRANKRTAKHTFVPEEYLEDIDESWKLNDIISFIQEHNIPTEAALFVLSLRFLIQEGILANKGLLEIIAADFGDAVTGNKQIGIELKNWAATLDSLEAKRELNHLFELDIPQCRDVLGLIYQSLLLEGAKAQNGSYYTPREIVSDIANDYLNRELRVLDPCCGSGQFLLAFAGNIHDPGNLFGIDIDALAVRLARLNILVKFRDIDFIPNIFHKNTLLDLPYPDLFNRRDNKIDSFDLIATNPPWGAHFVQDDMNELKRVYPEITSLESFSYFLKRSMDLLNDDGILSFILPESILNVKTHRDIRAYILDNAKIEKIVCLGRAFKNVFSPVIRLDLRKRVEKQYSFLVCKPDDCYNVHRKRMLEDQDYIFNIHTKDEDHKILDKVFRVTHCTLKDNTKWALGIVTGNNKEYVLAAPRAGYEEIFKGKDVDKFTLSEASGYIHFEPDKFQQVAPEDRYRAKEKLIYRFISKYLVFAYDDQQRLTLNSANIIIPQIDDYPMKVILGLFNSSLYQFIFQKTFASIKVLRGHLEQLPLPLWDMKTRLEMVGLVDKTITSRDCFHELDDFIMHKFMLTDKEIDHIRKHVKY